MPGALACCTSQQHMPSFDLKAKPDPRSCFDLILCKDLDEGRLMYGISHKGKDLVAYIQEAGEVLPLGNWTCLFTQREPAVRAFELARCRGLRVGGYLYPDNQMILQELDQIC